jgi:hypothetical protein
MKGLQHPLNGVLSACKWLIAKMAHRTAGRNTMKCVFCPGPKSILPFSSQQNIFGHYPFNPILL